MNAGMVLSMGGFFTLMAVGLASTAARRADERADRRRRRPRRRRRRLARVAGRHCCSPPSSATTRSRRWCRTRAPASTRDDLRPALLPAPHLRAVPARPADRFRRVDRHAADRGRRLADARRAVRPRRRATAPTEPVHAHHRRGGDVLLVDARRGAGPPQAITTLIAATGTSAVTATFTAVEILRRHQPVEITNSSASRRTDRDFVGQQADNASDSADRERHADGRLHCGRHRNARTPSNR